MRVGTGNLYDVKAVMLTCLQLGFPGLLARNFCDVASLRSLMIDLTHLLRFAGVLVHFGNK